MRYGVRFIIVASADNAPHSTCFQYRHPCRGWLAPLLFDAVLRVDTYAIDHTPPHRMPRFIPTGPLLVVPVQLYATPRLLSCQLQLS